MLQECMIYEENSDIYDKLCNTHYYVYEPSQPTQSGYGRPMGGLAIFYKKQIYTEKFPINKRLIGIKCKSSTGIILLINVYMPCDYHDIESEDNYIEQLAQLSEIIQNENYNKIYIIGDFNADPNKGRFYNLLYTFSVQNNLIIADIEMLPYETFTYISPAHNTCGWLDHILTHNLDLIISTEVLLNYNILDHFPMKINININLNKNKLHNARNADEGRCNVLDWNLMSKQDITHYNEATESMFSKLFDLFICNEKECIEKNHISNIDYIYGKIINCMITTTNNFKKYTEKTSFKPLPGYNKFCKLKKHDAQINFWKWISIGKPRFGNDYENMKSSRKIFLNAIKYCRQNERNITAQIVAEKCCKKNKNQFWKQINSLNNKKSQNPTIIDNCEDPKDITNIFKLKYQSVLDDPLSQKIPEDFYSIFYKYCNNNNKTIFIDYKMVQTNIKALKPGIGHDEIHTNHLVNLGVNAAIIISKLFTSMLSHGYTPHNMLLGVIEPRIKDKTKDLHSSTNFRPIMKSSTMFRLFELCLKQEIETTIRTDIRQFGFKKNSSCAIATYLLQETIESYNVKGSDVWVTFLDISKAYDRVNPFILIMKLINKKLHPKIVRLLYYIFNNTYCYIKYNDNISLKFQIKNSVRQGGLISSILFILYIDEIISKFNKIQNIKLHHLTMNLIAYCDDMCLIALNKSTMQNLLNLIYEELEVLGLKINTEKTVFCIFNSVKLKYNYDNVCLYINNNNINKVKSYKYLGYVLDEKMSYNEDVKHCTLTFNKQFFSMYRKLYYLESDTLIFLFKAYCMSFYSSTNWYSLENCKKSFNTLATLYHKHIKKIYKVNKYHSNHIICKEANILTFKHFISTKILNFVINLVNGKNNCLKQLKYYFMNDAITINKFKKYFEENYNISNIFENDLDALHSRIQYVEKNEPTSLYEPIDNNQTNNLCT